MLAHCFVGLNCLIVRGVSSSETVGAEQGRPTWPNKYTVQLSGSKGLAVHPRAISGIQDRDRGVPLPVFVVLLPEEAFRSAAGGLRPDAVHRGHNCGPVSSSTSNPKRSQSAKTDGIPPAAPNKITEIITRHSMYCSSTHWQQESCQLSGGQFYYVLC